MNRPVLVVDFGAQYAQLIARRVREASVYSEIVHHNITAAEVAAKNPLAIILSGGPSSVYEEGSPQLDKGILELGIPVLGICYGFQTLANALGGRVDATGKKEYGATQLRVTAGGEILAGQPSEQICWMSHGDQVMQAPEGFEVLASTDTTPVAAFANSEKKIYGVQWHPEVKHSQFGQNVLENFLHNAAGIAPTWNSGNVIAEQVEKIRAQVGNDRVICGLSGGVDSAVAAALVHKAVGDQLICVFVNHGLLREGEAEQVERDALTEALEADGQAVRTPLQGVPGRGDIIEATHEPEPAPELAAGLVEPLDVATAPEGAPMADENGEPILTTAKPAAKPAAAPAPFAHVRRWQFVFIVAAVWVLAAAALRASGASLVSVRYFTRPASAVSRSASSAMPSILHRAVLSMRGVSFKESRARNTAARSNLTAPRSEPTITRLASCSSERVTTITARPPIWRVSVAMAAAKILTLRIRSACTFAQHREASPAGPSSANSTTMSSACGLCLYSTTLPIALSGSDVS